jgi:hypothetical protein
MPALVAGIDVLGAEQKQDVDGRDKPGHDQRWEPSSIHHALAHAMPDSTPGLSIVEPAAARGLAYCFFGGGFGPCRGGSDAI